MIKLSYALVVFIVWIYLTIIYYNELIDGTLGASETHYLYNTTLLIGWILLLVIPQLIIFKLLKDGLQNIKKGNNEFLKTRLYNRRNQRG